jgi:hypothetical protein
LWQSGWGLKRDVYVDAGQSSFAAAEKGSFGCCVGIGRFLDCPELKIKKSVSL